MDWQHLKDAFDDELIKIAEVSLRGLSPESVLQGSEPLPPSDSPGFQKARSILELAASQGQPLEKVSYRYYQQFQGKKKEPELQPDAIDKVKSFGLHVLSGGGAGRFAAEFRPKGATPKQRFIGTAVGAGLGAAEYGRKRLRIHKAKTQMEKKSGIPSPGIALRSTQQVGKIKNVIHSGKGIKAQIPTIGRKGL